MRRRRPCDITTAPSILPANPSGQTYGKPGRDVILVAVDRVEEEGNIRAGYGHDPGGLVVRFDASMVGHDLVDPYGIEVDWQPLQAPCRVYVSPADILEPRVDPRSFLSDL